MAYSNGLIPRTTLVAVNDGRLLRADAAAAFHRLNEAFAAVFGKRISVTDGYRDLAQQVLVKALKGIFAATPGKSNHGWGIALDLGSGINSATSAEHRWMDANAHRFGWVNPTWARDNNPSNGQFEPWHWEYVAGLDQYDGLGDADTPRPTPTITLPEDDMPTAPEVANAVLNTPDPALGGRTVHQVLADLMHVRQDVAAVPSEVLFGNRVGGRNLIDQHLQTRAEVAGLQSALTALAKAQGADPAVITKAVRDGVTAALKGIETTVTVKGA